MDSTTFITHYGVKMKVPRVNWSQASLSTLITVFKSIGGTYDEALHSKAVLIKYLTDDGMIKKGVWISKQIEIGGLCTWDVFELTPMAERTHELFNKVDRILEIEDSIMAKEREEERAEQKECKKRVFAEGEFFGFGPDSMSRSDFIEILACRRHEDTDTEDACHDAKMEPVNAEPSREVKKFLGNSINGTEMAIRLLGGQDIATKPSQS